MIDPTEDFGENLARFDEVADRMKDNSETRHFYHSLIVACAKRMKHGTFLQALNDAKKHMEPTS